MMERTLRTVATLLLALAIGGPDAGYSQEKGGGPVYFRRAVALCIGIETFQSQIPAVTFGEADARAMSRLWRDRYGYEVRELIGERATRPAILAELGTLAGELTDADALVVFIATHGQVFQTSDLRRHGYLLTYDSSVSLPTLQDDARLREIPLDEGMRYLADWEQSTLSMNDLLDSLGSIKAKHSLLLVDACYSGYLVPRALVDGAVPQLLLRGSRNVVTATTIDQKAYPSRSAQHGYFTAAVLKHLQLRDAACLTEVFFKVRDDVAAQSGNRMLPMLAHLNDEGGEFVFLPRNVKEQDLAVVLKPVAERARNLFADPTNLNDVIRAVTTNDYRFAEDADSQAAYWKAEVEQRRNLATAGDPLAMAILHYCYSKGLGVEQSPSQAAEWAQRCFDTGEPIGQHVMGRTLLEGIGRDAQPGLARKLYETARGRGFVISGMTEASLIIGGRPIATLTEAEHRGLQELLIPATQAQVPAAFRLLGLLSFHGGQGVPARPEQAVREWESAVRLGDQMAGLLLAEALGKRGPAVTRDLQKGRTYLLQAVDAGLPEAQVALANELLGDGAESWGYAFEKDLGRARRLIQMAADQGNTRGMVMLAGMHENGVGGEVDLEEARRLVEQASARGEARALAMQGQWYLSGVIYPQDYRQALAHFRRAAESDNSFACRMVGALYENGLGFDLNGADRIVFRPEALHWYLKAHRLNQEKFSGERLQAFRGDLNVERIGIPSGEVVEPSMTLRKWRQAYPDDVDYFEKTFPGPSPTKPLDVTIVDLPRTALGFGVATHETPADAEREAKAAAIDAAVGELIDVNADAAARTAAREIAEKGVDSGRLQSVSLTTSEGTTLAVCTVEWDHERLTDDLRTGGAPLKASPGELFAEELGEQRSNDVARTAIPLVLELIHRQSIRIQRGARPKLTPVGDRFRCQTDAQLTVNVDIYAQFVPLLKTILRHMATHAAEFEWTYALKDDGGVSIKWPHDHENPALATRTLDLRPYLPDEVRPWLAEEGSQPFLLIESLLEDGDMERAGRARIFVAMLPESIKARPRRLPLRASLVDAAGETVATREVNADASAIAAGGIRLARTPGNPFGARSTSLVCLPLLGGDAFSLKRTVTVQVDLELTRDEADKVADWKWEMVE